MNVLLTGASGFLGRKVAKRLGCEEGISITLALRNSYPWEGLPGYVLGDFSESTDWMNALSGQDVVIHAAARSHVMSKQEYDSLAEYREVNVLATLHLARQAALSGVKRFIFISSVKVNGELTSGNRFIESDIPRPEDAYGLSKLEAEQGLLALAEEVGMEVVILRPPLIYGAGVKGNFSTLINLVSSGLPLPFGAIDNKRSFVAVDNLVDLIVRCIDHPAAANQIFLVGDGEDLSTTELLKGIADAMGRSVRLISVPGVLLELLFVLLGRRGISQRLLGSLQVDITKARDLLSWEPLISTREGLKRCVRDSDF